MHGRSALALALTTATFAAAPATAAVTNGLYRGDTRQDLPIKIRVSGDLVKVSVKVSNNCGATDKPIVASNIPLEGNRFDANLGGGEFKVSGRFSGSKVSGRFRLRQQDPVLGTCDTKRVTYTAKR